MNKSALLILSLLSLAACGKKEEKPAAGLPSAPAGASAPVTVAASQTLEVGCAACVYKMAGTNSCALAAKVDGKPVLVTGVPQPGHDAGICEHTRQAEVTGQMEGDHFVAATFALKP